MPGFVWEKSSFGTSVSNVCNQNIKRTQESVLSVLLILFGRKENTQNIYGRPEENATRKS